MRVIAGKAKRLELVTPKSMDVRPTNDRIKETLFNMINPYIYDCNFLDVFSGSGGIGIEALSRGARHATFIDNNKESLDCIKKNLEHTKLLDSATIYSLDALTALKQLETKGKVFDIIFIDPPYDRYIEKDVLEYLSNSSIMNEDSIIITEASVNTDFSYIENTNLQIDRIKDYKSNVHVFLSLK